MMVHTQIAIEDLAQQIASLAVEALLEELHLTPKPGLVDRRDNGCHHDLSLSVMEISAYVLKDCFYEMVLAGSKKDPSQQLREQLAAIGRYGEEKMLRATGNVNTHKGAIWAIGLLAAAAGVLFSQPEKKTLQRNDFLFTAGDIASFQDRYAPLQDTKGNKVRKLYLVRSAREEAMAGFPTIRSAAFPAWDKYEREPANIRKLNVLLAIMSVTDDTCILYRSNLETLCEIKQRAKEILNCGGMGYRDNHSLYDELNEFIQAQWVSPGGSADLLAATLFLHKIIHHFKIN